MKKLNTLRLGILLVALLLIYGGLEYFSNTGRSKSLRTELVSLDKEGITQIIIFGPGKNLTLSKTGESWEVNNGIYSYPAEADRISTALATLETIKPSRIATRNPAKWQDFQVDSTGTRVQVKTGNDVALDIVLGRFGMQGQQQFHTYVRLFNENDVYVANDFMAFSFPQEMSGYRNNAVLKIDPDSLRRIRYNYPDSAFALERSLAGHWVIDSQAVDSTQVTTYLNGMRNLISTNLFEGDPTTKVTPDMSVEFFFINGEEVKIDIQQGPSPLLQSSQNTSALFSDGTLLDKILAGRSTFISEE